MSSYDVIMIPVYQISLRTMCGTLSSSAKLEKYKFQAKIPEVSEIFPDGWHTIYMGRIKFTWLHW